MPFPSSSFVESGRFTDVRLIGRGAGGQVYYARDNLGRAVAVKEVLPSTRHFQDLCDKLQKEAQIQAALQHPNIVHVYHLEQDPASHERYLICEYVPGGSLADHLRQHGPLAQDEAIAVAIDICRALEAIGDQRIVHRDIKPSNILLVTDERGRIVSAKLGDFGVAQDRKLPATTHLPGMAHHPGTPEYMAPEQADITRPVDARTDLYALGITLWEMLTGTDYKLLFAHDEEPDLAAHRPQAHPGLAAIVAQAVREDRLERYPTPQAMARELAEVRDGSWKRTRSTIALGGSSERLRHVRATGRAATAARPERRPDVVAAERWPIVAGERRRSFGPIRLLIVFSAVGLVLLGLSVAVFRPARSSNDAQIAIVDEGKPAVARARYDTAPPLVKALAHTIDAKPGAPSCLSPQAAPAEPSGADPPLPRAVPNGWWEVVKGATQLANWESSGWALGVGVGADGQLLAATLDPGAIRIWRVEDGTPLRSFCAMPDSKQQPVAFSFDGRTLGLALDDGTVALWRVSDGVLLHLFNDFKGVTSMATTPDGETLATAMSDGTVTLWRVSDGARLGAVPIKQPAIGLAIAPDAQTIATVVEGGNGVLLWRVSDGSVVGKAEGAESLAFSPDGQLLAAGSNRGPIALWDMKSGQLLNELKGHTQGVLALAFAPDGKTLVSSSEDNSLRLWGAPR